MSDSGYVAPIGRLADDLQKLATHQRELATERRRWIKDEGGTIRVESEAWAFERSAEMIGELLTTGSVREVEETLAVREWFKDQ